MHLILKLKHLHIYFFNFLGAFSISGENCGSYNKEGCKKQKKESENSKKFVGKSSVFKSIGIQVDKAGNLDKDTSIVPIR